MTQSTVTHFSEQQQQFMDQGYLSLGRLLDDNESRMGIENIYSSGKAHGEALVGEFQQLDGADSDR